MLKDILSPEVSIENGKLSSNLLPLIKLNSFVAKQLKEYKQIKIDLELVKSMFMNINRLADEELNYPLKYSLWFTATTAYFRCFSPGKGRGITLEARKYINHLEQKYIDAHEELLNQRHKYMAHADHNEYEAFEVFGVLDFDNTTILGHSNFFTKTIVLNKEKPELYAELVSKVIEKVSEEEDKKSDLLLKELATLQINENDIVRPLNKATNMDKAGFYSTLAQYCFMELKNYKAAITFLSKAIELFPNVWELYANRANAYREIGDEVNMLKDNAMVLSLREN
ncbi:MAG: hypothetical protein ABGX20_11435 [Bacillus sp. (in: firmicutes)]